MKTRPGDVHLHTTAGQPRPLPKYSVVLEAGTVGRVFKDGRLYYEGPGRLFILKKEEESPRFLPES